MNGLLIALGHTCASPANSDNSILTQGHQEWEWMENANETDNTTNI